MSEVAQNNLGESGLQNIRGMIDMLDEQIIDRLVARFAYTVMAAEIKEGMAAPVLDESREAKVLGHVTEYGGGDLLPAEAKKAIFEVIMEQPRNMQHRRRDQAQEERKQIAASPAAVNL